MDRHFQERKPVFGRLVDWPAMTWLVFGRKHCAWGSNPYPPPRAQLLLALSRGLAPTLKAQAGIWKPRKDQSTTLLSSIIYKGINSMLAIQTSRLFLRRLKENSILSRRGLLDNCWQRVSKGLEQGEGKLEALLKKLQNLKSSQALRSLDLYLNHVPTESCIIDYRSIASQLINNERECNSIEAYALEHQRRADLQKGREID